MADEQHDLQEIKVKLGVMERDIHHTDLLCSKLSDSIEKLQELNTNIIQMMGLHGQRHDQHEKNISKMEQDIKELHSRITTVSREIHERIDEVEHHISSRIDSLRIDLLEHQEKESKSNFKVNLPDVEKWKWILMGALISAGFFLGKIEFSQLLPFIK